MKAFVLNLARRPDRLRRFMDWNGGHGLEWTVVPAVDGAALDRAALVAAGLLDPQARFTAGAAGNALSHRAQWQDCAQAGAARLVCEDDACLHPTLVAQLPRLAAALAHCDLIFLGFNTNVALSMTLPDGMVMEGFFGTTVPRGPDHYRAFATSTQPRPPSVVHPARMVWGSIAYLLSPAGARRLLEVCFPLSSTARVVFQVEKRQVVPVALDGIINAGLQAGTLRGGVCFPPLAISPNDLSDVSAPGA